MSPSEGLGDGEVAAVHKEIYGARCGFTSLGVKKCEGCATLGAGAERACQVGVERVMLQGAGVSSCCHCVSSLGGPVDKLSRPGLAEALVALVAWRNCELRSLRARGDLVQPRAPSEHLGAAPRCVESPPSEWPAGSRGLLSDCPLLAVGGAHMCDIDDTLNRGPILESEQGAAGGWGGAEQDEHGPFSARLLLPMLPISSLPSYEDLLFCTCTLLRLLPSQGDVGMTLGWSSPILPVSLDLDILLFGRR